MTDFLPVTLVTQNASCDPIPDDAYLAELRRLMQDGTEDTPGPLTYRQLMAMLGEDISRKPWWQHRVVGNRTTLDHNARAILRRVFDDLAPPAPPVTLVTDQRIDPDAAMHWIGPDTGEKSRLVLMIAPNLSHVEISVNGTVQAHRVPEAPKSPVTRVTFGGGARREPAYRPRLSLELKARIEASGRTIEELINEALGEG